MSWDGGHADDRFAPFTLLSDGVFCLDAEGAVAFANQPLLDLLGYDADEVVGHNMLSFVHPDELVRAVEIHAALQGTIGVAISPSIFHVRRADDRWMPLELMGSPTVEDGPLAGLQVLVARYSGDHDLHDRITRLLTRGAPLGDVLALVPEFGRWRHPTQPYLAVFRAPSGEWVAVGDERAERLWADHRGPATTWRQALAAGEEVAHEEADLEPALREAAVALGLSRCLVVPVVDPGQGEGAVIAWSTAAGPTLAIHRYAVEQMASALSLVMQWHRHIAELERSARFDELTGLANRSTFLALLEGLAAEPSATCTALIYLDLDGFKALNDHQGHAAGDHVLQESARRMADVVRELDTVARLGGDEFAVLCPEVDGVDAATTIADRLLSSLRRPVPFGGEDVEVSASIGIALADARGLDAAVLLERADEAMYAAKSAGKDRWHLDPGLAAAGG